MAGAGAGASSTVGRREASGSGSLTQFTRLSYIGWVTIIIIMIIVIQPIYESRMNWIIDPTPPASAVNTPPSEAHLKLPKCSRRRRKRKKKAAATANDNSAPCTADVTARAEPTANDNSARWRATRPRSAANDRPGMRSTPVKHPHSFTSSPLSQLPIPAANQNAERASCQDHSEILGLYKLASTDPRQDLTARKFYCTEILLRKFYCTPARS